MLSLILSIKSHDPSSTLVLYAKVCFFLPNHLRTTLETQGSFHWISSFSKALKNFSVTNKGWGRSSPPHIWNFLFVLSFSIALYFQFKNFVVVFLITFRSQCSSYFLFMSYLLPIICICRWNTEGSEKQNFLIVLPPRNSFSNHFRKVIEFSTVKSFN